MAELDATMPVDELAEWRAYHELEPFGSPADDHRWRIHYSLFYSANSKAGAEIPELLDRDPEETARKAAAMTLEEKLEAYFGPRAA